MKPRKQSTTDLRKLAIQGFDLVAGGHTFFGLLEFDITNLREHLRQLRRQGQGGSLFAYFLKAVGRVLDQVPALNAFVDYSHTTYFTGVDVNVPVEVSTPEGPTPRQLLIKDINSKTLAMVDQEMEAAKKAPEEPAGYVFSRWGQWLLCRLPRFLVRWLFRRIVKNHTLVQRLSGNVFVTTVSMFSTVPGFILPYVGGPKAVSFAFGSVLKKPLVRSGKVEIRETVSVTVAFNHDIIDGAPAARGMNLLRRYLEGDPNQVLNPLSDAPADA